MRLGIKNAGALLAPALVAVALVVACGGGGEAPDGRLRAVASMEVFADMARQVAGDRIAVEALLPSGADPHTFELTPKRVAAVAEADIVFINGLGLEAGTERLVRTNARGPVIELTEGLETINGDGNPHLWLDVRLAARYVERIRDAFVELDPEGRTGYFANAEAYLSVLGSLDQEIVRALQSVPPENRRLVTFHDAFPYLAARYGLEVVAVVVPSPGQAPNARAVADLSEKLEQAPAVFREPQSNSEVLEQAAEDAGVEVFVLLSDAFTEGVDSYVELMRFNVRQLVEGLGRVGFAGGR